MPAIFSRCGTIKLFRILKARKIAMFGSDKTLNGASKVSISEEKAKIGRGV